MKQELQAAELTTAQKAEEAAPRTVTLLNVFGHLLVTGVSEGFQAGFVGAATFTELPPGWEVRMIES